MPPKIINNKNNMDASSFSNSDTESSSSSYDDDYSSDEDNCINIHIYNKNNNQKSDSLRNTFFDIVFISVTIFATIGFIVTFL